MPFFAYSSQLDRSFTLEFYKKVLSCPEIALSCLKQNDLIKEIHPNVYAFKDPSEQASPEEEMSAKRTSAVLNLPILLIPNLPGIKGVPGVDAVVFNEKGSPLANISIKSFTGTTDNGNNTLKRQLTNARSSHSTVNHRDYLPNLFGFLYSENNELVAKKETRDQELRRQIILGASYILGTQTNTLRDVWLVIDFASDPLKKIFIEYGGLGKRIQYDGTFLRIRHSNESEAVLHPKVVSIDLLTERTKKAGEISKYVILVNDSTFIADKDGYRIITGCATALNNSNTETRF